MKTWKIELTISVSDNWIEDGFNLSDGRLDDLIEDTIKPTLLPYAYGHELQIKSKILKEPDAAIINKLQGYE